MPQYNLLIRGEPHTAMYLLLWLPSLQHVSLVIMRSVITGHVQRLLGRVVRSWVAAEVKGQVSHQLLTITCPHLNLPTHNIRIRETIAARE